MFIATLLTNPATPILDRATVEAVRNAWGGGDAIWLAPGIAAEFPVQPPQNVAEVWTSLQGMGIDLVIQPGNDRRKKVLLADMDSTMIGQECIDELAAGAGVGGHVAAITARAIDGELDFDAALRERVALLNGLATSVIDKVLAERITLMPGGAALVATMKAHGAYTALVSGGFTAFTQAVAARLGFDENRANTLLSSQGRLTGQVAEPILGREAKLQALNDITARLGHARSDVLAVGDGMNDLLMLAGAGTGVAFHAKPALQQLCDVRINHGDLTALLYLQGYHRDMFAA
ncbi:MAG: phosphoserine phosphatase SerB [Candidatus Saccharibacteria bacterium]|nr:phosphoserine phosphatase SerB [Pseudorhodobacter sp.]